MEATDQNDGRRMSQTATALPSAMPQAAKTSARREGTWIGTGVLRAPADVFDFEFGLNTLGTVVLLPGEVREGGVEIAKRVGGGEEKQNGLASGACSHDIGLVGIVVNGGNRARGLVTEDMIQRGGSHVEKLRGRERERTP